jgi:hypothetical protein
MTERYTDDKLDDILAQNWTGGLRTILDDLIGEIKERRTLGRAMRANVAAANGAATDVADRAFKRGKQRGVRAAIELLQALEAAEDDE